MTAQVVGGQYLGRVQIGDAVGVLELLWLMLTAVLAWLRPRHELVLARAASPNASGLPPVVAG